MTALKIPADDAPAKKWGALAVRIPDWRWMPGMRYSYGGFSAGTGASENYVDRLWEDDAGPYDHAIFPAPDPDDPATAGCLLALLGNERWRLHLDDVGEWSLWVNGPPQTHGTGHLIHVGESLGRACIRVAAVIGRWPGGDS